MTPRQPEPFTDWTATTRTAIRAAPGIRALAAHAGISPAELSKIAAGTRNATRRVAEAVVRGLGKLAAEHTRRAGACDRHAKALRRALKAAR